MAARHVILGVSASIALHRALDLASELRKAGDGVSVVMTPNAARLIAPLTFQAMALRKVHVEMFGAPGGDDHEHIRLVQDADLMIIAPASASSIGKLACGVWDNLLMTTAGAFSGPRLFAPAMNWRMWANPIVQRNCATLVEHGWEMIGPASGDLACGEQGPGRLAEVAQILARLRERLDQA